jgi:hypothetical protein
MLTDRKDLFVEAAGLKDVINASRHGQLATRDLIGLHLQRVEWDKDGFVARLYRLPAVDGMRLKKARSPEWSRWIRGWSLVGPF